jgi:hypothetical protein
MQPADALATIAELAVALTGFAGLLAAFRAARAEWQLIEVAALRILLISSVGVFVFAVLPFPLLLAEVAGERVWQGCSLALGAFLLTLVALGAYLVVGHGLRPRRFGVFLGLELSGLAVAMVVLLNSLGVLSLDGAAVYCLGLLWLLVTAALQFIVQIFSSWHGTPVGMPRGVAE